MILYTWSFTFCYPNLNDVEKEGKEEKKRKKMIKKRLNLGNPNLNDVKNQI